MSNYGFKLEEYENRLEKAQALMHFYQIDIFLITTEQFMRYFTGFSTQFWQSPTRPWYLIIPLKGSPKAVIPEIGFSAMQKTWIEEIYTWPSPRPKDEGISIISKLINEFPSKFDNVGVELGQLFVIVGCYFGFAYWIKEKPWYKKYFTNTLSILIALVGIYWFVERVI